jgi:hypothetical protein
LPLRVCPSGRESFACEQDGPQERGLEQHEQGAEGGELLLPKRRQGQHGGVSEANWIQTNPEKGFFAYFRWYSPTKAFFDLVWKMGNITEVK